jgi:type I restriction enzyme M protein
LRNDQPPDLRADCVPANLPFNDSDWFRKDDDVHWQFGEGDIRRPLIEADLVVCMVALPGQLFPSTQIPVCLWFLAKNKAADAKRGFRDRRQQILVNCDKPAFTNFSNK